MNQETKSCQNCKQHFDITPEDFVFYEKIQVPPPTWCPECRMIRRLYFRNERFLYRRKEDNEGKDILAMYPPESPVRVFTLDHWNSDNWEPLDYGRAYHFSNNFFEQFHQLLKEVPLPARSVLRMINSDYCNNAGDVKNGYLCFNSDQIEDSAYVVMAWRVKDSFELYDSRDLEQCYEGVEIDDSSHVFFSFDCEQCNDVWFSKDLRGCTNCFGCVNLRNKSYSIFNTPYTKEDYFQKIKELFSGSYRDHLRIAKQALDLWLSYPVKCMHGSQNTNVSGEHIQNSKNVHESFSIHGGENLKYCQQVAESVQDSYDYTSWGDGVSLIYESIVVGAQCSGVKFSYDCWQGSRDVEYCISCRSSSDCFGCIGLRKKQYCIFNVQYTKEEYFALREKIIAHMNETPYQDKQGRIYRYGDFFPSVLSPFAYNQTMANDFFPLSQDDALRKGFAWSVAGTQEYAPTMQASGIPDDIRDISDTILKEIIGCASCGRAYRIIAQELAFLKKNKIPVPRLCIECRFKERFKLVNPPKFWHAKCQCAGIHDDRNRYQNEAAHSHGSNHCPNEFETSYAPERPEIVYCEACYNTEVVG